MRYVVQAEYVIRDPCRPTKPYSATSHSFGVAAYNDDLTFHAGSMLTGVGPGGGKIYGELDVAPGTYAVFGVATCKSVLTNYAVLNVSVNAVAQVDLLPRSFEQCLGEVNLAASLAGHFSQYSFSSPEQSTEAVKRDLEALRSAISKTARHFPKHRLQLTAEQLRDMKAPAELIRVIKQINPSVA